MISAVYTLLIAENYLVVIHQVDSISMEWTNDAM